MNRLQINICFLLLINFMYACNTKKNLDKTIIGIWQIDSTESYSHGIKQTNPILKNYYWNFNEYNDLVFVNKDSVIQIHYFKIKDSLINCYNSKKDTSDWAFQLRLIKAQNEKIILQSIYDDNSATKFFMTKTEIDNIEDIINKNTSKVNSNSKTYK